MTWLDGSTSARSIDSASAREILILAQMMTRLLARLRLEGAVLWDDPTAQPRPGGATRQWRWMLPLGESMDVYEWERDLVATILACDCPCPNECGGTVRRLCTLHPLMEQA